MGDWAIVFFCEWLGDRFFSGGLGDRGFVGGGRSWFLWVVGRSCFCEWLGDRAF